MKLKRSRISFFIHELVCYRSALDHDPQDYNLELLGRYAGDSHRKSAYGLLIGPHDAVQGRVTLIGVDKTRLPNPIGGPSMTFNTAALMLLIVHKKWMGMGWYHAWHFHQG
ncbi:MULTISPECIES: hypothetical protein [unclassified Pseudomonas]|uniref:hypothetical protein n=1 Tax=unclassified Pseudomonas TaxID=196821 RepID=UPI002E81A4E3|nr:MULTISPECIES: hypothetical protein [unclassified Pseudomonas]